MPSSSSVTTSGKGDKMKPLTYTMVIDDFAKNRQKISEELTLPASDHIVKVLLDSTVTFKCTTGWGAGKYSALLLYNLKSSGSLIVHYRVSLMNSNNQKVSTVEGKIKFESSHQFKPMHIFFRDDILKEENQLLDNGKLTIYCELYQVDSILDDEVAIIKPLHSNLLEDYAKLLKDGKQSDITLVADGSELRAHKLILSTRSPVFAAMFEHDTKEKQQNRVEIEEMSGDVCKEMLNYIYTDQMDKLEVYAADLMVAADRYQLDHLKQHCEQYLSVNLTPETVAQVLVLADLHQAESLKMKCIEYICFHGHEVQPTEGWKIILTKPQLLSELFLYSSSLNSANATKGTKRKENL